MKDELGELREVFQDTYRLERIVGRGGMAVVYLAYDERHQRPLALKVLLPEAATALGGERFTREIRITAALEHPNILPLFDSGKIRDSVFYTMPYVDGGSLRDLVVRSGPLPIADAVRLAREAADALAYAHARGVIHRDIKPANILLSQGHV